MRWGIWTLVLSVVLCISSLVQASQLTAPGLAASDGMVVGNAVAYPFNAATALFHNPAQLSLVPNSFSTGAFNIMFHPSYENRHGIFLSDSLRGALPPGVDPEGFRAFRGFRPSADRSGHYDSTSREFPIAPNFGYRTGPVCALRIWDRYVWAHWASPSTMGPNPNTESPTISLPSW